MLFTNHAGPTTSLLPLTTTVNDVFKKFAWLREKNNALRISFIRNELVTGHKSDVVNIQVRSEYTHTHTHKKKNLVLSDWNNVMMLYEKNALKLGPKLVMSHFVVRQDWFRID